MAIVDAMRGNEAVIHLAGSYRVGIPASERPSMLDANLGATNRVLDAAATSSLERIVHVSTVGVFGNTHERIVDERYRRDLADGFVSYYDETKFLAHRAVEERIAGGAPVVIAMPGVTYGPRDHSGAGQQLEGAYRGTLRYRVLTETGISAVLRRRCRRRHRGGARSWADRRGVHPGRREHAAWRRDGGRGAAGRSSTAAGRRCRRPCSGSGRSRRSQLARAAGLPDDLGEVLRSSLGVTFWASSAKAAAELGYTPRDLASGLRAAFGESGGLEPTDRDVSASTVRRPRGASRRPATATAFPHATDSVPHGPRAPDAATDPSPVTGPTCRSRSAAACSDPAADGSVAQRRHPDWIRARMPSGDNYHDLKGLLRGLDLNTVCEEARCPNIGECWDQRTATIMILGDTCTRACGFCAVKTGRPTWFDDDEPRRVAEAVAVMQLEHVVVTSVARDDLPDGGSRIFAETITAMRERSPGMGIEVLIPDFDGSDDRLRTVMDARPDILNHNLETVQRLQKPVRKRARWDRSLYVLASAKAMAERDRLSPCTPSRA